MEFAADQDLPYVGEPLPLPGGFLDADTSLSSFPGVLGGDLRGDLDPFAFAGCDSSREMSPQWHMDLSSCADNLSDDTAPSLTTEEHSIASVQEATHTPQMQLQQSNPQKTTHGGPPRGLHGCGCISLASRVLSSMHAGSSSCILGMGYDHGSTGAQPQLPGAADAILSVNQSALRAVRSILKCSCYGSPQILLIVTVICSEVTAWYGHVVDIYKQGQCYGPSQRRSSTADSAVSLPGFNSIKVQTQKPAFFIGSYRLDKDVEAGLIRQILSGMLQELQIIIGDIASHTGRSSTAHEAGSEQIRSSVRARMVALLHSQLRALTSALEQPGNP